MFELNDGLVIENIKLIDGNPVWTNPYLIDIDKSEVKDNIYCNGEFTYIAANNYFGKNALKLRVYRLNEGDVTWQSCDFYKEICKKVKLGQILYDVPHLQGIVTKITYDREKKWWQFWIRRKKTGCYVEWRERNV